MWQKDRYNQLLYQSKSNPGISSFSVKESLSRHLRTQKSPKVQPEFKGKLKGRERLFYFLFFAPVLLSDFPHLVREVQVFDSLKVAAAARGEDSFTRRPVWNKSGLSTVTTGELSAGADQGGSKFTSQWSQSFLPGVLFNSAAPFTYLLSYLLLEEVKGVWLFLLCISTDNHRNACNVIKKACCCCLAARYPLEVLRWCVCFWIPIIKSSYCKKIPGIDSLLRPQQKQ